MTEIPDDVMKAVEDACSIESVPEGEVRTRRAIARAILAERERCAKVAEDYRDDVHYGLYSNLGAARDTCNFILEKIRSGS